MVSCSRRQISLLTAIELQISDVSNMLASRAQVFRCVHKSKRLPQSLMVSNNIYIYIYIYIIFTESFELIYGQAL
jgi:hypothetical protein